MAAPAGAKFKALCFEVGASFCEILAPPQAFEDASKLQINDAGHICSEAARDVGNICRLKESDLVLSPHWVGQLYVWTYPTPTAGRHPTWQRLPITILSDMGCTCHTLCYYTMTCHVPRSNETTVGTLATIIFHLHNAEFVGKGAVSV